jgi:hypothetical protein
VKKDTGTTATARPTTSVAFAVSCRRARPAARTPSAAAIQATVPAATRSAPSTCARRPSATAATPSVHSRITET